MTAVGVPTPAPALDAVPPAAPGAAASAREGFLDGRIPALLVFAVVLATGLLVMQPHPLGVFTDDAMYAILARSLVDGEGYRFINLPGSPAGTHFPPVYPAFLALLWKLFPAFPDNVAVFKGANALLNAVAAVLTFRLASDGFGVHRGVALFVAIAAGIGVPSLLLSGMVLSEPLFLVGLLLALPLAERVRRAPTTGGALLLGAAAGLLVLTRSIGVTFLLATLLVLAYARHWRAMALVAAAAAAFVVPWNAWVARHDAELPETLRGKYGSYSGWLSQGVAAHGPSFVVETVARNAPQSVVVLSEPLRVPRWTWMPKMVWTHYLGMVVAVGLGVAGLVALLGGAPVAAVTFAGYLALVFIWPFDPTRFIWGVWPLFLAIAAAGATWALARARTMAGPRGDTLRAGTLALAGAGAVGAAAHLTFGLQHDWSHGLARARAQASLPIVFFVQEHTRPDAVVASDEEAMVYLYTGRRGVPNTRFTPDEYLSPRGEAQRRADFDAMIAGADPDWLVVSMQSTAAVANQRAATRGDIRQVGTLPDGSLIFERVRDANRTPASTR